MQYGVYGQWNVLAPAGLTDTGRIRKFQNRTVERLRAIADAYGQRTNEALIKAVEESYTEGSGELARTLQYSVDASRDQISVSFVAGTNHLVYLTSLAGLPFRSQGHIIRPTRSRMLRFYWKNPPGGGSGVYAFRRVHWRTRIGRDVIAETLSAGAQQFQQAMIAEHDAALVDFMQNELQLDTRSTRVSVRSGSGIPPQ